MISSEKLIVRVAWNPARFQVIAVVPKGQTLNADYDYSSAVTKLSNIARQFRNATRRKLIVHADKTRPHAAKSRIEF
jgi:hypothetical protein